MEPTEEHQTEEGVDDEDTADKSDVEIITERPETDMVQPKDEQYGAPKTRIWLQPEPAGLWQHGL
jgi:hypothetical protein